MGAEPLGRKLAAILYADVAGYSRLTGEDEEGTHRTLRAYLDAITSHIQVHEGRVVHYAGDAVLAEFATVSDALSCAVEVQRDLKTRNEDLPGERKVQFRIGVNLGEVIVDQDEIYGDGVNIAARLETLADPGGICVSEAVYSAIGNKLPLEYVFLGEQSVKNIEKPVRTYSVIFDADGAVQVPAKASTNTRLTRWSAIGAVAVVLLLAGMGLFIWHSPQEPGTDAAERSAPLPLPDKPSIAVLPFSNMSGDPNQGYFSDGISEDIITDLSKVSNLRVIARNSSFSYRGKSVKIQTVGEELGVQYVLEGSVRKVDDRVRITAQLVKASDGYHVWAERYDRKLVDIFALQDEITHRIVSALLVELTPEEKEQLTHKTTDNFEAYDLFLQGLQHLNSEVDVQLAQDLYQRAIELDPKFGRAYGALAVTLSRSYVRGSSDSPETLDRALGLAQKAVMLNPYTPQTYWALGYVYLYRKEYDKAIDALQRAVTLAPNYADGYGLLALINNNLGRAKEAIRLIQKAMTLNPNYTWDYPYNLGRAYYAIGRYPDAVEALQKALARNPQATGAHWFLAASYVRLGQLDDAEWQVTELQTLNPNITLLRLSKTLPIKDEALLDELLADLRKAGLPD
jgi:adenylate cyclase